MAAFIREHAVEAGTENGIDLSCYSDARRCSLDVLAAGLFASVSSSRFAEKAELPNTEGSSATFG